MTPGLTKLNIKPQSGSLNAMKASFTNATKSQGISYNIMAQRSIFSTNMLTNPKMGYAPGISSTRMMLLNATRLKYQTPVLQPNLHQCNGEDSMNKFMMGMMAMNMVAEMTKSVTAGIKDIKAANAERKTTSTSNEKVKAKEEKTAAPSSNTVLSNLNKKLTANGNEIKTLGSEYSKNVKGDALDKNGKITESIQSISRDNELNQHFPTLNQVTNTKVFDDIKNLDIDENSSFDDITKADLQIDKDISSLNAYLTNVTSILGNIPTKKQELSSTPELQTKNAAILTKLNNLEKQLTTINEQVQTMKEKMGTQKSKLDELCKNKKNITNAIYDQAKENFDQVKSNNKKMSDIKEKIDKLKPNSGDKDKQKMKKLVTEYNTLAHANSALIQDINAAGGSSIKNSEGHTIDLPNLATMKTNILDENGQEIQKKQLDDSTST